MKRIPLKIKNIIVAVISIMAIIAMVFPSMALADLLDPGWKKPSNTATQTNDNTMIIIAVIAAIAIALFAVIAIIVILKKRNQAQSTPLDKNE